MQAIGKTTRQMGDSLKLEQTHLDIWDALLRAAQNPPESAARVLELVQRDREWDLENRKKRNTIMAEAKAAKEKKPAAEKKEKTVNGHALTTKITFGSRKVDDKDVPYGTDEKNNPRRGTAAPIFALYKKNMKISDAIEAGIPASKIKTDLDKGYIVVVK